MKTVYLLKSCCWYEPDDICTQPVEGNADYCPRHNRLIRKQITDEQKANEKRKALLSASKKVYKAPNKVSDKRKELNKEYFALVEQFKKDNPKCKARIDGCTDATEDCHHSRGRGKYLLDVSTWIPVCRHCHNFIEQHPLDALRRNLSFSRLGNVE